MRKLKKTVVTLQTPVKVNVIKQNVALISRVIYAKQAMDSVMDGWVTEQPVYKVEEDGPKAGEVVCDDCGNPIVIRTEKEYEDHRITEKELEMLDTQVYEFIKELYELIVEQESEE